MLEYLRTACILLLIVSPVELRKVSAGGGGRGQSAARGNVGSPQGGGNFNQGGGFNQGGFNQGRPNNFQQPNSGFHGQPPHNVQQPHGGFNQPSNWNRGPQGGSFGHVPPAKSSNTFAKALVGGAAGALGGILIYEAGKAIIRSATEPYSYNGRNYYWNENKNQDPHSIQCSMPLQQLQQDVAKAEAASTPAPAAANGTETTTVAVGATTTPPLSQTIGNLQFQDGTRPRQIVWSCKRNVEVCCGADCCPAPVNNNQASGGRSGGSSTLTGVLVAILLIILIGGCCCCLIAYKMCRSAFDCILPREQKYDDGYQQNGDYSQQQQQYPMQQYPNQQPQYPPQQQQYPQQQPFAPHYPNNQYPQLGYPNTYPSQPTY